MLHGMSADPVYKKHREEFEKSFVNANEDELTRDWDRENSAMKGNYIQLIDKKDRGLPGSEKEKIAKSNFRRNWVDGQIRNLMFEGTPEEFKENRYWPDAKKVYLADQGVKRTFTQLQNYLKTGSGYALPEVEIKPQNSRLYNND